MGKHSDFTCEFYSDRGNTISDLIGQGKMCFTFMDTGWITFMDGLYPFMDYVYGSNFPKKDVSRRSFTNVCHYILLDFIKSFGIISNESLNTH